MIEFYRVGVVQLNAPKAAYSNRIQIFKQNNRGAHGLKAQSMSS
jgi:hypothetical protein